MLREKIFKGALFLWASVLALLCCSVPASALSVSELEQISDASEAIELAEPEEGYDFDATFLDKNLELSYKATIENDEEFPIRITSITLNESEYDFLEYSYAGIELDEIIEVNETREIVVTVKTNNNETQTVSEDYNLTVDYESVEPGPNPETSTTTIISTISAAVVGVGAVVFVFARSKKIRQFAIIFTIFSLGICALSFNASATEETSFSILGKVNFINTYTVTMNPNGGVYDGKTTNTEAFVREGGVFHVDEASREHFEFVEWEVNPGELDENNDIEIHANTTIKAKWNENTYTLTIKPNGGEYLGSTEEWSESFRPNESTTISTPELEGYDFVNWTVEKGNVGTDGIFTGSSINMVEDVTLVANFEIKHFTVTVIPNGGTYHESTNTFTTTVDWGTDYEIESISRDGYDLKDWTKTVGEAGSTLAADTQSINVKEDVTLEANWWSSTFYTVTINPNGGVYDNKTEASEYSVREGTDYTMLEATYDGQLFHYWHYTDTETRMDETSFTVIGDVSLTAEWQPIIARIESTQKLYPSIMAAHDEVVSGETIDASDTITLLVDMTEEVTNTKTVKLDLGGHTVTGSLTNTVNGNIVLLNGEINNPDGSAVTNNGTLTMGIDDYDAEDGHALVSADYVRLVGTDIGLLQNSVFNFYDGYIEGDIGLYEGYDDSPFYRRAYDGKEIKYFPFVSNIGTDGAYRQHVELQPADRAVTKTIDKGEIYYYKIQDNVDASVTTGYDIYAVRDFVSTSPVTIPEDGTIAFDVSGFNVSLEDDWVNNGSLTIKDSKTGDDAGEMDFDRYITNNGDLTLSNVKLTSASGNAMLYNNKNLTMTNSVMTSSNGPVLQINQDNATFAADEDSYVITSSGSSAAIDVHAKNFTVLSGNIQKTASASAITVSDSGSVTIKGGTVSGDSGNSAIITLNNYGTLTVEDSGKIKSLGSGSSVYCYYGSKVYIKGGEIFADTRGAEKSATAIDNCDDVEMTGGKVSVYADAAAATAFYQGNLALKGGTVHTENAGTKNATAWQGHQSTAEVSGGQITVKTKSGTAIALTQGYDSGASMSGGNITAETTSGIANAVTSLRRGFTMTGGEIHSDTYGISGITATIGANNGSVTTDYPLVEGDTYAINGGAVYFYDGLLKGGTNAVTSGAIVGVPDGYKQNIERIDGVENDWLKEGVRYLEVNGTRYSSMKAAYDVVEDNGLVKVVEDASVEGILPANPSGKTITFDLGGHTLQVAQPLNNNGKMTIIDNSQTGNTGKITNTSGTSTLSNSGELIIEAGEFYGNGNTITFGSSSAKITLNEGLIKSDNGKAAIYGRGNIVQNGGTISLDADENRNSDSQVVNCDYNGSFEMNGGRLESAFNTNRTLHGIEACSTTINDGVIDLRSEGGVIAMYQNTFYIKGGAMYVESAGASRLAYLHNSYGEISGGSVEIKATGSSDADGFYNGYRSSAKMTGGTLTVTSQGGSGYGARNLSFVITGGTVKATTYAYSGSEIIIGENKMPVSTDSPRLEGGTYAINGGSAYFYDGILVGGATDVQNASDTIKAVPDGYYRYSETIDGRVNSWLKEDSKYLQVVGGDSYSSLQDAWNNVPDGGTIKVIEDKTTTAALPASPSDKSITFDLNDHTLIFTQPLINNGTMTIVDDGQYHEGILINNNSNTGTYAVLNRGTMTISSGKISSSQGAIKNQNTDNSSNAKLYITGGEVKSTGVYDAAVVNYNSVEISGGSVISDVSSGSATAVECANKAQTLKIRDNGFVSSKSGSNSAEGVHFCNLEMTGGTLKAEGSGAYATLQTSGSITGGTVRAKANIYSAYLNSVQYSGFELGGTADVEIEATGSSGDAYGFDHMYNATFTMSGGTLKVKSANGTAYGAYGFSNGNSITGGTIISDDYGIYSCNVTLGDNNGTILETPTIIGGKYALYGGSINFYDGVLKGGISAYYDRNVKAIATNSAIVVSKETIDGSEYDVKKLSGQHTVAMIGSAEYPSIMAAHGAAEDGDEIVLVEDNYVFEPMTFSKNVTLNLNDHTIITGNPITISGNLTINNGVSSTKPVVDYHETGTFITVNSGASLTVSGIGLGHSNSNYYVIQNSGSTTINNSTIETDRSAIRNLGTSLTISGSTIEASNYAVIIESGGSGADIDNSIINAGYAIYHSNNALSTIKTTVDESTINGRVHVYKGQVSFGADSTDANQIDSTLGLDIDNEEVRILYIENGATVKFNNSAISENIQRRSGSGLLYLMENAGTLDLNNTDIAVGITSYTPSISVLYNSGTASLTNSDIEAACSYSDTKYMDGIRNTGGTLIYTGGAMAINRYESHGIYVTGGIVNLTDSEVYATGTKAYGAIVDNGELTMGVPEDSTSPNYNTENADVSLENPVISGIGSNTGIGVQKGNGRFNFYDGVIIGSSNALPVQPTNTESQYEVKFSTGTDGYSHATLDYIRNPLGGN